MLNPRLLVTVALAVAVPTYALAHGGGYAHGCAGYRGPANEVPPSAPEPPPPPDCTCGQLSCTGCSLRVTARQPVRCTPRLEVLARTGDLEHVRVRLDVGVPSDVGSARAHVRVEKSALFAVSATWLEQRTDTQVRILRAIPRHDPRARRRFLGRRRWPLVVSRDGGDAVHARAHPVRPGVRTQVVIEAYVLTDRAVQDVHLYRTGDRVLAVEPRPPTRTFGPADVSDERYGRRLTFLSAAEARRRYGALIDDAHEVPCVVRLEQAAQGTATAVWVADGTGRAAPVDVAPPPDAEIPRLSTR